MPDEFGGKTFSPCPFDPADPEPQEGPDLSGPIPAFKNTGEALEYGAAVRNMPEGGLKVARLVLLRAERARLVQEGRDLMEAGREGDALFLLSGQSQFVREALEEAERPEAGRACRCGAGCRPGCGCDREPSRGADGRL